jgi:hypothetical protein
VNVEEVKAMSSGASGLAFLINLVVLLLWQVFANIFGCPFSEDEDARFCIPFLAF